MGDFRRACEFVPIARENTSPDGHNFSTGSGIPFAHPRGAEAVKGAEEMSAISTIHEFLREAHVPYTVVTHPPAFTARGEAAATHVPGRDWAKVVVCVVDGDPIEAVVPAPMMVDLERLLALAGGKAIRLAREDELLGFFPGCDAGAIPPLGPVYGHVVFVDVSLAAQPEIVFSAGTHVDATELRWTDFARTVRPIVGRFAAPSTDRVAAYRLSHRE